MALTKFPINNFRGGLNTRDSPFELQPNESPDLLNVTITALVGQLRTREGRERYGEALPNEEVNFAKQCVIGAGKRFLMLSINGNIYSVDEKGKVVKRFAGTPGTIWDFEVYSDAAFKDWVYCGNGVDAMQKWDGEAAATVEWKATIGAIPKGGVLCVWENRMFISYVTANVQRVYFSEFSDPEATVKEYGFVDVRGPEDDLDAIQDLCVLGARLFILKRRDVFFISSSVTMLNRRIGGPGVWSRFQVAEMEDKLYFFNPQGIFSTAGVTVAMESGSVNSYFPKNLNFAQLEKVRVMVTKDTYPRLLLALPTGEATSNNILMEMIPHINFRRIGGRRYLLLPAFMIHTMPATVVAAWNPTGHEEIIIGAAPISAESSFPEPAVLDTFNRPVENPLSNGGKWTKWTWSNAAGVIAEVLAKLGWAGKHENSLKEEGARWNVTEFATPQVSLEMTHLVSGEQWWQINANYASVAQSGYSLRINVTNGVKGFQIREWVLFKKEAGVETVLGTGTITSHVEVGAKIGLSVVNKKVAAWFKPSTGAWEKLKEVEDGKYTKGYVGVETRSDGEQPPQTNNFSAGEFPSTATKLFRLFHGLTDDGIAIASHWQSAWFALQGEEPYERIRRVNVELLGDAYLDVFTDFESEPRYSEKLPEVGELGETHEPSGEGLAYRFTRLRPETFGRFHAIRLRTDPSGTAFQINVAEIAYRGGKEH